MAPININAGGTWGGEPSDVLVRDGGVWKSASEVLVRNAGIWTKVYPSFPEPTLRGTYTLTVSASKNSTAVSGVRVVAKNTLLPDWITWPGRTRTPASNELWLLTSQFGSIAAASFSQVYFVTTNDFGQGLNLGSDPEFSTMTFTNPGAYIELYKTSTTPANLMETWSANGDANTVTNGRYWNGKNTPAVDGFTGGQALHTAANATYRVRIWA